MSETFTCCLCGETFDKSWTDEEADAEFKQLYGDLDEPSDEFCCTPCWEKSGLSTGDPAKWKRV